MKTVKTSNRPHWGRAPYSLGKFPGAGPSRVVVVRASPESQPAPVLASNGGQGEKLTAVARVDVGYAVEQLNVPITAASSQVLTATLSLPMGLVIEEVNGLFVIVEVTPGGSAWEKKVQVGDVVRGLTAASMQMTYPTMNLMFGGGGRPKLTRVALPATGRPFLWLRDAIKSNTQLPGPPSVTLILERVRQGFKEEDKQSQGKQQEVTSIPATSSLFDPSLFE